MSGPRNRKAAAAAARARELLHQVLLDHARAHPLSRAPTARELLRLTGLRVTERRIQQVVASLRIEQEIRELLAEQLERERIGDSVGMSAAADGA